MIMTTTAARLDPAHWRYLAEGKLHVVVAFQNSGDGGDAPPSPFRHHALRLLKERHPDAVGAGAASALYGAAREREYLDRVAGPALGFQYVDLGWTVPVTREFLEGVAARIAPARPPGRAKYGLDLAATTAECLRNLTQYFPPVPCGISVASAGTFTLELKPKAGYASRSYLVAPEHRAIKHRLSRFQIMQRYKFQLKLTEAVEPEWGVLRRVNLDYSPIDLFSGQATRMAHALRCLLRNPQNFCQLFAGPDGAALYGRGLEDPLAAHQAIAGLLPSLAEQEEGPFDALAALLARLLAQEPLLARLRALQAMDVLDVEGAGLVLDRLTALCVGDEAEALARLAAAELKPLGVVDETRLTELEGVLARPTESVESGNDDDEAAWLARHAQAKAAVAALAEDDCVLLLRRWLVSLGACDASLMVSLRRCESESLDSQPQQPPQTAEAAGVLHVQPNVYIAYCAHVVDLGPKPPGKVRSKAALEQEIVALAGRPLDV